MGDFWERANRYRFRIMLLITALVVMPLSYYRLTQNARRAVISNLESTRGAPDRRASIRVGAYNIAHGRHGAFVYEGREFSRSAMIEQLKEIGRAAKKARIDILALNETDFSVSRTFRVDQARIIARAAGLPFIARQANVDTGIAWKRWYLGNALLSRFPIREVRAVSFPERHSLIKLAAGNMDGLLARVRLGKDQSVTVMAVHLEVMSEHARVESARELIRLSRNAREPLIILGDFNSTPRQFPHSVRDHRGENAMDLLIASRLFTLRPLQGDFTFPTRKPQRVIDWILINRGSRFVEHAVPAWPYSDHLPVLAEVIPAKSSR